jgi:superfamily II DNA or RNA helicase
VTPRDFQQSAIAACTSGFESGKRAICLVSPTGSGKTCMGAMIAASLVAQGKRVAWGAHRHELVEQAAMTLHKFGVQVGKRGLRSFAPVQIGMFQTWISRREAPDADFFIADECHHLADRTGWTDLQRAYMGAGCEVLGLTATPARGDGQALSEFDHIVVAAQISQLQKSGILVPLQIKLPSTLQDSRHIAQTPAGAYREHADGRSTVVFCPHVRACESTLAEFEQAGVRAKIVTGDMSMADRRDILWRFHCGDIQVLINVNVLTEGWDCPRASCCILARGCGSLGLLIQIAGRVLRPWCTCGRMATDAVVCSCAKASALLIDLKGATLPDQLGRPDADHEYHLDGAGITTVGVTQKALERLCRSCRTPLGDSLICPNPECMRDHSFVIPKATGAELEDWESRYDMAKAALSPTKLVLSLAGILRKADESSRAGKPWKNGAVGYRFSMIFKRHPYPSEVAAAENLNRTARNAPRADDVA